MRTLDIRRHTMRRKPGAHLSQDGIALARLIGENAGPYDLVVTSTIPRAVETAIATWASKSTRPWTSSATGPAP